LRLILARVDGSTIFLQRWYVECANQFLQIPMFRVSGCALIAVFFIGASSLVAQRHGRADSAANNSKNIPDSSVTVKTADRAVRWGATALGKLPSGSVEGVRKSDTGIESFHGVAFAQLLPTTAPPSEVLTYEIHYGFFRTRRLDASDLDPTTDLFITDDENDGFANRLTSIRIVAKMRDGRIIVLNDVYRITVTMAHRGVRPSAS
jgi:hypothetical protein